MAVIVPFERFAAALAVAVRSYETMYDDASWFVLKRAVVTVVVHGRSATSGFCRSYE